MCDFVPAIPFTSLSRSTTSRFSKPYKDIWVYVVNSGQDVKTPFLTICGKLYSDEIRLWITMK